MSEPQHMSAVLRDAFAAVGSPGGLTVDRARLLAVLSYNQAAASHGRAVPGGEVLLGVGTASEVDAMLALARALPAGGPFAAEYSPTEDAVRVETLANVVARGRDWLQRGVPDPAGWYCIAVGEREQCEQEATRLRRIRAGHRSQESKA